MPKKIVEQKNKNDQQEDKSGGFINRNMIGYRTKALNGTVSAKTDGKVGIIDWHSDKSTVSLEAKKGDVKIKYKRDF